ncbi:MAG: ubiquitin-conjugating enzyme E2 [Burkholderiales bacterium]
MNPRIAADVERLRALDAASNGKLRLTATPAPGAPRIVLELGYATAGSHAYPLDRRTHTRLVLDLPSRYPFQPPVARITTPILHPNVFASGVVCLGTKWLPSEGIDLFVERIARLVTFDPLLVNVQSVANREALGWYHQTLRRHPEAFPSDRVDLAAGGAAPERVIRNCPHCGASLRLPVGRQGPVRCPKCAGEFETRT